MIRSFSHVGRVQLGDLVITVIPKLDQGSLLYLLRYTYGFRNLRLLDDATQKLRPCWFRRSPCLPIERRSG